MRYALALLAPFTLAATAPQATVTNPVINGTFATATITTTTDDRLEGLSAPGGIAMLHTIVRHHMALTKIPFKANKPRRLTKYGYHIMLMHKLTVPTLPMTLIFRDAGPVQVVFRVVRQ